MSTQPPEPNSDNTDEMASDHVEADTDKRRSAIRAFALGSGLIGLLFLGGAGIAWFIQGPIFYEHKTLTLSAKILGNHPGALGIDASMVKNEEDRKDFKDERHWFVLGYPGCEAAKHGFWVPDEPRASAKQATLLNELRTCFLRMKTGESVDVVLRTREKRSTRERTWRVERIGECDAEVLTNMMHPAEDATRCDWM